MIGSELEKHILQLTKASSIVSSEVIQSLWSGYGEILRVKLSNTLFDSIIIKKISFPTESNHPRGWNTSISHERKVKSYKVEQEWYLNWNSSLIDNCRTAKCLDILTIGDNQIIVLEDLDSAGFKLRKSKLSIEGTKLCLKWLANFHAINMGKDSGELWGIGSYWHLSTRMHEFDTMTNSKLKENAHLIDESLNNCQYKTIIHGDAKVTNFCFSEDMKQVSAVDFQYVGAGCGIKDVIYLFSSCLSNVDCEKHDETLLEYYFNQLEETLKSKGNSLVFNDLKEGWTVMYSLAWSDFVRFLQGWSPKHYKLNSYSLKKVIIALNSL